MLRSVQTLTVALAQIAPRLGALETNLATHHARLDEARALGADLVVFPELGLTGYQLQDLASEVAMRLDDPRLAQAGGGDPGPLGDRVVRRGIGRPPAVHRGRPARGRRDPARPPQALPADLRPLRRAPLLRRRRRPAGGRRRAWGSGSGSACARTSGTCRCPQILALDGAQILINVSSSPGRDLAATNEVGLGTATSWRTLMRTYAQLTTSFVIFCNRVGVDESISFWGGSEVIAPTGQALFSAPLYDEGLFTVDIAPADIRRERIALPLLRDERPELNVRELQRIVAERSGLAGDSTGDPGAEPGLDVAPAEPPSGPIGFRPRRQRTVRPVDRGA